MARDLFFLKQLEENPELPGVFTVYSFSPPCISLGRLQKANPELMIKARNNGFETVKRPTGGRLVIHHPEDITYSLILSKNHGFLPGKVRHTYELVKPFLIDFLSFLNIRTDENSLKVKTPEKELCFATVQPSDITAGGKKVSGNALFWLKNAFLLQGTFHHSFRENTWKLFFGTESLNFFKDRILFLSNEAPNLDLFTAFKLFKKVFEKNGFSVEVFELSEKEKRMIKELTQLFKI